VKLRKRLRIRKEMKKKVEWEISLGIGYKQDIYGIDQNTKLINQIASIGNISTNCPTLQSH
jgi:hypothetical protein